MNLIDQLLNRFTMYRVVLYGLLILVGYSLILSLFKILSFPLLDLCLLLIILVLVCFATNLFLSKILKIPINSESSLITALILYFLLFPSREVKDILIFCAAAFIAMASKFLIAYRRKHIFNPAAFAAFIIVFLSSGAIWWVATPSMLPLTLIVGLLVIRKIRKFSLFFSFIISSTLFFLIQILVKRFDFFDQIITFYSSFPVIFFATIMLPEPLTLPPTRIKQIIYGITTGILFSYQGHFGSISITSELALLIGNFLSFILSPKIRLKLNIVEMKLIAKDTMEIILTKPQNFKFNAGQYLEWTIPQLRTDSRGNRRYFTIASAPTDKFIRLGIKISDKTSSFKRYLKELDSNKFLSASSLAGDFILPHDKSKKIVFIAGGIGITPFRSMISYLLDKNEKRDIVLFYLNKDEKEIAFKDIFDEANKKIDLKTVYLLTDEANIPKNWTGEKGRLNETIIMKYIKNYNDHSFYLSGPIAMVESYKRMLKSMGVKRSSIITDYFPGF